MPEGCTNTNHHNLNRTFTFAELLCDLGQRETAGEAQFDRFPGFIPELLHALLKEDTPCADFLRQIAGRFCEHFDGVIRKHDTFPGVVPSPSKNLHAGYAEGPRTKRTAPVEFVEFLPKHNAYILQEIGRFVGIVGACQQITSERILNTEKAFQKGTMVVFGCRVHVSIK